MKKLKPMFVMYIIEIIIIINIFSFGFLIFNLNCSLINIQY